MIQRKQSKYEDKQTLRIFHYRFISFVFIYCRIVKKISKKNKSGNHIFWGDLQL